VEVSPRSVKVPLLGPRGIVFPVTRFAKPEPPLETGDHEVGFPQGVVIRAMGFVSLPVSPMDLLIQFVLLMSGPGQIDGSVI
jgi:hypothetical protein